MTFRAVLIGVIGAIIFAAGGRYANAYVPRVQMVRGHLPITVFGSLIFFVMAVNPLIGWVRKSWKFKPSEIALILALFLGVCAIIDAGLMRYFPGVCVYPLQTERTRLGWQTTKVVSYVPPIMMANDGRYSEEVVEEWVIPGDPIKWPAWMWRPGTWIGSDPNQVEARQAFYRSVAKSWDRIPWYAWKKPVIYWGLVVSMTFAGVIGLSVLVHRQWARRERIRYPLAEIASSLLVQDQYGRTAIFRNKLFWIGLIVPLFIRLLMTIGLWYPDMITIPLSFDFPAIRDAYPKLMQTPGSRYLAEMHIYPTAVGLAFLLGSDIGLSLGLANPISVFAIYFLVAMGVDMSGGDLEGNPMAWQTFGGYLAFGLMLLYIGRRYYWVSVKQAVTFVRHGETDNAAVWGLRVFLFCAMGIIAMLISVGLAWHIAIVTVLTVMLGFLVMARLNAEAGAFFYKPSWYMPGVLLGMYGFSSLGAKGYMAISLLFWVLMGDPFECLMPFAVNGLKTASDTGLKTGRMGLLLGITVLGALAVTIPTGLWSDYQQQAFTTGGRYSHQSYEAAERYIRKLDLAGELDKSNTQTSWERLKQIRPEARFLMSAAIGFGLVLALAAVRLRFTWWPLHPLIVLTFGAELLVGKYGASFLMGWFIKVMVTKLAGASRYATLRPLMMGVIIGDLLGGFLTTCVIWGIYFVTGVEGPNWRFW